MYPPTLTAHTREANCSSPQIKVGARGREVMRKKQNTRDPFGLNETELDVHLWCQGWQKYSETCL